MKKTHNQCDFCNEINNFESSYFKQNFFQHYQKKKLCNRIIFQNEHFFVIPSAGPISKCHLLICPVEHVTSYATLNPQRLREATDVLKKFIQLVKKEYGCAMAFEHGSNIDGIGSASCNHAHFHVIAAQINIEKILEEQGFNLTKISHINDIYSVVDKKSPYFLIINTENEIWVTKDTICQSQYLRQLCAKELNLGNGLWQNEIGVEQMINTNIKLKKYF